MATARCWERSGRLINAMFVASNAAMTALFAAYFVPSIAAHVGRIGVALFAAGILYTVVPVLVFMRRMAAETPGGITTGLVVVGVSFAPLFVFGIAAMRAW